MTRTWTADHARHRHSGPEVSAGPAGDRAVPEPGEHTLNKETVREWSRWIPVPALLVLLAGDAFFIAVHLVDIVGSLELSQLWSLEQDNGYPELYGYGKMFLAAMLLLLTHRAVRQQPYRALAIVLLIIGLDDAFSLHEAVGAWLARSTALEAPFGLRPQDLGELGAFAALGLLSITLLFRAYTKGDRLARQSTVLHAVLLTALFGFAVVVDMVHVVLEGRARTAAAVVEDGGELVVLSLILALSLAVRHRVASSNNTDSARPGDDE